MLKHIVMFKVKEECNGKSKQELLAQGAKILDGFKGTIPTLLDFEYKLNMPGTPDVNFDIALFCEFNSIEEMDEYKNHPKHLEFRAFITEVREQRACIDYEI